MRYDRMENRFRTGPIVKACNKLQVSTLSGPCSVSQKAAEVAYAGTQEPVKRNAESIPTPS